MLPIAKPELPPLDQYVARLQEIWQTRSLSNFGKYAREFERIAGEYMSNPHTRSVVSCDIGLMISLAALDLPRGSECLVPSFTFNSTINSILWNGLTPVFVDLDPATLNVDIGDVRRRISDRTAAIVATHVFGSPFDVDALLAVAGELPLVVDAAHGYGASYKGKKIGDPSLGAFQVFSFSGTKQVTSGEGGLIAAGSAALASRIEFQRAYGFKFDYVSEYVGVNGKMSELHAALGALMLDSVDEAVAHRNRIAAEYRQALAACKAITFQTLLPECLSAYKDFAILCSEKRDELSAHLGQLGIQTKKYFRPLHTMTRYSEFRRPDDDLGDTEQVYERVLCLPIYNELQSSDVAAVAEVITDFYGC